MARIGIGLDVHRYRRGQKLILGGVEIPYEAGLVGHSDADALTHAICDALLGAAGLQDIGRHFPDSDLRYRDVSSLDLLEQVRDMLNEKGYAIGNIDAVIVAEAPRLSEHLELMAKRLAATLGTEATRIHVKATRAEGMGALGRGEGVLAQAVAVLVEQA